MQVGHPGMALACPRTPLLVSTDLPLWRGEMLKRERNALPRPLKNVAFSNAHFGRCQRILGQDSS